MQKEREEEENMMGRRAGDEGEKGRVRGWKWGSEAESRMERRQSRGHGQRERGRGRGGGVYLGRVFMGVDLALFF